MKWRVELPDGWPLSLQYRALALAAALARRGALIARPSQATHALRLLSLRDQLDLVQATPDPREMTATGPERPVLLRRARALGQRRGFAGAMVCMDAVPTLTDLIAAGPEFAFAFSSGPGPAAGALPSGVRLLAPAVDDAARAPAPEPLPAAVARHGIVFLLSDPEQSVQPLATLRAAVAPVALTVFDPYAAGDLPREGVVGPCAPSERVALWRRCRAVVTASEADACDDAFAQEARAAGARVHSVAEYLAGAAENASAVPTAAAAACWQSFDTAAAAVVDPSAAPAAVLAKAWQHDHAGVRVVLADQVDQLARAAGESASPQKAALAVCLGTCDDEEGLRTLAARAGYEMVFVVLAQNATLGARVLQAALSARLCRNQLEPVDAAGAESVPALVAGARRWLHHGGPRELHVLVGRLAPLHVAHLWRQLTAGPILGRVAVHMARPGFQQETNAHMIGATVASTDLVRGWALAAMPRCRSKWMNMGAIGLAARRTILPTLSSSYPRPAPLAPIAADADDTWSFDALREAFGRDEVDAYFNPGGPMVSHLIGARNAWAVRAVPVVGVVHSVHGLGIAAELERRLLAVAAGPFDALISPTSCGKRAMLNQWQELLDFYGPRAGPAPTLDIDVVPYGIDTAAYAGRHRGACRRAQGIDLDAVVFCSVGRYSLREKGDLVPLLLAFAQLARTRPDVRLLLAGHPNEPTELNRLHDVAHRLGIGAQVDARQSVSAEDKAQLVAAADVFVSVSDNVQETFGLALCEAMAAGTPVLAPAWNGFKEIVEHGQTGLLVPAHWCAIAPQRLDVQLLAEGYTGYGWRDLHETVAIEVPALTRAMEHLADNQELRRRMGERAQQRAVAEFDFVRQSSKVVDAVLARAQAAKASPSAFCPPAPRRENIARSFAHYPSHWADEHTEVTAGHSTRDPEVRRVIFDAMSLDSPAEQSAIERAVARASERAVPLSSLAVSGLTVPRLLRCVKYGLLQWAHGAGDAR